MNCLKFYTLLVLAISASLTATYAMEKAEPNQERSNIITKITANLEPSERFFFAGNLLMLKSDPEQYNQIYNNCSKIFNIFESPEDISVNADTPYGEIRALLKYYYDENTRNRFNQTDAAAIVLLPLGQKLHELTDLYNAEKNGVKQLYFASFLDKMETDPILKKIKDFFLTIEKSDVTSKDVKKAGKRLKENFPLGNYTDVQAITCLVEKMGISRAKAEKIITDHY